MNKQKSFLILIVISLIMLIGPAAGCAATAPTGPAGKPTINSFTASPASISAGQQTTLSWNVSGATTTTIEPAIGTVGSSGSLVLAPPAGITYTLTATNQAGSTGGSVTVAVTSVAAGKPDLVISDAWLLAETIYYKVKNQGTADSKPTRSVLYVNGFEQDSDFIDVLAAGEEETNNFGAYRHYQQEAVTERYGLDLPAANMKVCIDEGNTVDESNEGNNCFNQSWGDTETYDFRANAHLAKWRSSAGDRRWGGLPSDEKGTAYMFLGDLYICPEKVSNGWMLGRFYNFAADEETNINTAEYGVALERKREIEVPENAKFIADLGFRKGYTSTDGVRVALGYINETFSLVLFPKMDVSSDGKLHTYEVDLSDMAGTRTQFFLWVEAKDSPEGDCVKWVNPRIIQE